MDSLNILTKNQRIILGLVILLLVDIIWISSSELTAYTYIHETFQKPFFCTYIKTSMFAIYLLGFILWPPWKDSYCSRPSDYIFLETDPEDESNFEETAEARLSNPTYVPVKTPDREYIDRSSETESDDSSLRSVRFNKMAEVRHMSEAEAKDALLARLSYQASLRASESIKKASVKLPIYEVAKVAFLFCFLIFSATYMYQLALLRSNRSWLNIFFSTSSIFTLFLSGMYPASHTDKFTISKLVAVILSVMSMILINIGDIKFDEQAPVGAALSLLSAFFSSTYVVFLKRVIENDEKMDIPLFLGFVGLFIFIFLWPIFLFLHFSKLETFEWPTREQMIFLILSTFMETVIPEALWLWSRLLTSSLVAIMAKTMIIPMTMITDAIVKNMNFSYVFYIGLIPMTIAFFMIIIYLYFDNWDPLYGVLCVLYVKLFRKATSLQLKESTSEQLEALIGINNIE
ncbi:solute carrier family 35 member F5 isoform X2 [Rhynchophorus ferrugineus]|uniref:solute carrier family 35 member F5 isoform X2 n=1 Tax=Rhynchophorus ferrugineus TaxID=354439 RepID=UPI003FCE6570